MAENSKIQWTTHTWNPWRGCTKVSPGCKNCYAETLSGRNPGTLGVWGPGGTRVVAAESAWKQPLKWDRVAKAAGERHRVFCASLADVFEDWRGPMVDSSGDVLRSGEWCPELGYGRFDEVSMNQVRDRLGRLVVSTPHLDWLLLTKRPENALHMMTDHTFGVRDDRSPAIPPNVWLGTSVEDQTRADERIPELLEVPAAVRFLSVEPMLGPVDLTRWLYSDYDRAAMDRQLLTPAGGFTHAKVNWVIVGGESGPGARPFELDWARSIRDQCDAAGVPWFFKQAGSNARDWDRGDPPNHGPPELVPLRLRDRKGGDLGELPAALRVRESPR